MMDKFSLKKIQEIGVTRCNASYHKNKNLNRDGNCISNIKTTGTSITNSKNKGMAELATNFDGSDNAWNQVLNLTINSRKGLLNQARRTKYRTKFTREEISEIVMDSFVEAFLMFDPAKVDKVTNDSVSAVIYTLAKVILQRRIKSEGAKRDFKETYISENERVLRLDIINHNRIKEEIDRQDMIIECIDQLHSDLITNGYHIFANLLTGPISEEVLGWYCYGVANQKEIAEKYNMDTRRVSEIKRIVLELIRIRLSRLEGFENFSDVRPSVFRKEIIDKAAKMSRILDSCTVKGQKVA